MSIKEYLVPYSKFCGLKYAASHGKTCKRLTEIERTMCECAEIDLEDAGNYFRGKRIGREGSAFVIFRDCEFKIPALEHAARELQANRVSAAFEIGVEPTECDFPEFSDAIEARHPSGNVYYTWPPVPAMSAKNSN